MYTVQIRLNLHSTVYKLSLITTNIPLAGQTVLYKCITLVSISFDNIRDPRAARWNRMHE